MKIVADDIIQFWFQELTPEQWWIKSETLDADIAKRFLDVHLKAASCELWQWRDTSVGRLAEIIILDQFSRNMYRGTASAFAFDALALALAQEAVNKREHESLTAMQRGILYMPYMHSESASIHREAEKLFKANGLDVQYQFELKHKLIIDRFGRYPHRNKLLGRQSSSEELEFLKLPDSGF